MRSVLQEWVMELPLREQGTLLTAVRGCDDVPKLPLDSTARQLTAAIRCAFMVPADPREVDAEPGCFMQNKPPVGWKASELGHLPLHWYAHMMHAAEVIGYRHPTAFVRREWQAVYQRMATALHLTPEGSHDMICRLSEDRIAKGEIVS